MSDQVSDKKKSSEMVINTGLAGAQAEAVQRYGAAVNTHIVAYKGVDEEKGAQLAKGLKDLAQSKVDPAFSDVNVKQQAGFAAEIKTAARDTSEQIISGNKNHQVVRTDDMRKQSDGKGHTVGGKNEQLYDIAEIDQKGVYVEGTARQLKYVGGNPQECTQKLLDKKFDKYRDADVPIEVPADFFEDVKADLDKRSERLLKQIEHAEESGNYAQAVKHRERLKTVQDTKKNLRKGKLTNEESIEARLHPVRSTAKDIAKVSHRAGVEGTKTGVALGGGISLIQNTVAVIKGDKTAQEALLDVTEDTTKAAAITYTTNFVGASVKGIMQNASSSYIRTLSKTNLPATIVVGAMEVGKTLSRFGRGEIDGTECLTELGEKGSGMIMSAAGATVGQILIPIPVVGGLIGSMAGYAMSSAYYNGLVTALEDAKLAHEERLFVEAECQETVRVLKEYQLQIELAVNNYMKESIATFRTAFSETELAYNTGNDDLFIQGTNRIVRQVGGRPLFESAAECDAIMNSPITIKL